MNIPELISLTTPNTKPSSILSNAIPQAADDFQKTFDFASNSTEAVTETEDATGTDDVTQTETAPETQDTPTAADSDISEQAEQFATFLTLLTAQIKNQDPLAPLDSTQFVDQLATFSNLELQAEGNKTLENIASLLASQVYNSGGN